MMHHRRKPTHITICTVITRCRRHGSHRVVLSSLDASAITAAALLKTEYEESGLTCEVTTDQVALSEARRAAGGEEIIVDDLPF